MDGINTRREADKLLNVCSSGFLCKTFPSKDVGQNAKSISVDLVKKVSITN